MGAKLLKLVEKLMDAVVVVMFIAIFVVAMAQIIMRWVVNNPLTWSEELVRLVFVWICFIGWVIAVKNKSHICITAVISRLNDTGKKILETFNILVVIAFSIFMVVYGIQMSREAHQIRAISLPFISYTLVYAICPFSNALIIIYKLIELVGMWSKAGTEVAK